MSDLFLSRSDGHYYYLVSGRWFRSPTLNGPWSYATDDLPADFARLPDDHPRSAVRTAVPGTSDAEEAVMQAQIPTVVRVERGPQKLQHQGESREDPGAQGHERGRARAATATICTSHAPVVSRGRSEVKPGGYFSRTKLARAAAVRPAASSWSPSASVTSPSVATDA